MILAGHAGQAARTVGLAVWFVLGSSAAPEMAMGAEQEWTLTLAPGLAAVPVAEGHRLGLGGGGEAHYGVTDAWGVRTGLEMYGTTGGRQAHVAALSLGGTYTVDVVRVLPFFDGSLCAFSLAQPERSRSLRFGIQAGAGADYLLNRRWSVGGVARYAFAPFVTGADEGSSHVMTLALRLSYRLL